MLFNVFQRPKLLITKCAGKWEQSFSLLLILKMQRPKDRERMALEKEEWREEKLTKVKLFLRLC